ncbi:MAG: hypothetical protein EOP58_10505 [Sphingomonadales bacterium]|nr:MAG: hypothetical protein EOP58_10505 [Sphingomonadales bacterium]
MGALSPDTPGDDEIRPEPSRARAVFSTEDFRLLRTAVLTHLKSIEDSPDSIKYSNLYHRLGRSG